MSFFDDISDSFESLNHAPIDNTMRFMDNHGEAVTKTFIAAALLYALGGAGGGESGGGSLFGGSGSSGGWIPQTLQGAKGMLGNLGGGGGQDAPPPRRRRGILDSSPSTPLFNDEDPTIAPSIAKLFKQQQSFG